MTDKQVAVMQAGTEQAQAAEAAPDQYAAEAAAVDPNEDISMEEVMGPGTHKKPVANEDADLPKVESQTV